MKQHLDVLAAAIGVTPAPGYERIEISGVSEDSRRVKPGYLFAAIPGRVTDGHRYIHDAIARGASAIVGERELSSPVPLVLVPDSRKALAQLAATFFGYPTRRMFTVGVTGTNGKTTVCHLISHLLGEEKTTLLSTVANEKRGLHAVTTPESPIIQEIGADAVASGKENFVIEVSSASLLFHRVDQVDFDVAVFTNLTHDHLDLHQDRETYLRAKLILFQGLSNRSTAIVNIDDPVATRVIGETKVNVITYAVHQKANLRATEIGYSLRNTRFNLWQEEKIPVRLDLPGEHNVYNALAAAAVARLRGISLAEIKERLERARSVEGRYQFLIARNGATIVVDFAHSPDSLARMLRSLRPNFKRVICVFGCGGESDREKRPIMGEISGRLADLTILTTDNPKNEEPAAIIAEIEAGIQRSRGRYAKVIDRQEAIRRAVRYAASEDVVLIAGKGHEPYQIVGHTLVPYSDVSFLRQEGLAE